VLLLARWNLPSAAHPPEMAPTQRRWMGGFYRQTLLGHYPMVFAERSTLSGLEEAPFDVQCSALQSLGVKL
jgi:hypothetical protein